MMGKEEEIGKEAACYLNMLKEEGGDYITRENAKAFIESVRRAEFVNEKGKHYPGILMPTPKIIISGDLGDYD